MGDGICPRGEGRIGAGEGRIGAGEGRIGAGEDVIRAEDSRKGRTDRERPPSPSFRVERCGGEWVASEMGVKR